MKLVIIGSGGHARVVLQIARARQDAGDTLEIAGFCDAFVKKGQEICGIPNLGHDDELPELKKQYGLTHFVIGVGSVRGGDRKRADLFDMCVRANLLPANLVHPSAVIAPDASLGGGTVVMPGAVINTGVETGVNCIFNSRSSVDHDSRLGNHVHIAPGAVLSGNVQVGDSSLIGVGSTLVQSTKIGSNVTIGAGAVVLTDIPDGALAYGCPAREKH